MSRSNRPINYEIRVQGEIDAHWSTWFGGLEIANDVVGETTLAGPLPDQAALHGVLTRICDLSLPLISVRRLDPEPSDA
jgi:hypothetical protein